MRLVDLAFVHPEGARLGPLSVEGPDDRPWLVLGERGSGKTTLLRLLGGGLKPRGGAIEAPPRPLDAVYLPQFPERALAGRNLAEDLSGNVRPVRADRARLRAALAVVGLPDARLSRRSRALSVGERRRVALALLLASPARDWALDEPDAGLDVAGRTLLSQFVRDGIAAGRRIWIATHRPRLYAESRPFCLVVRGGQLAGCGGVAEILGDFTRREAAGQASGVGIRLWRALRDRRPELPSEPEKTLRKFEAPIPQVQEILTDSSTCR